VKDVGNSRDARKEANNKKNFGNPEGQEQQYRDNMITNKDLNSSRDGCNSRDAHSCKEVNNGKEARRYRTPATERRLQEQAILECQQQHRCHKQWERQ
jgi:hypothetical protein